MGKANSLPEGDIPTERFVAAKLSAGLDHMDCLSGFEDMTNVIVIIMIMIMIIIIIIVLVLRAL